MIEQIEGLMINIIITIFIKEVKILLNSKLKMSTDNAGERRFLLLKKRLDALHYCQPFGMESAALVEKLFNDLVKTTEGFQQIKKQSEEVIEIQYY